MRKIIDLLGAPLSALLALSLGLGATAVLFADTKRLENDKSSLAFEQRAELSASTVRHGLEEAVENLTVINQLFATVKVVTREQFRTFTLPLLQRYPYVQAFNFHRYLPQSERAAYEQTTAAGLRPGFQITAADTGARAAIKNRYYVVDYLEPMRGNEHAFGLDTSDNASVMDALDRAIESNSAAATSLLRLAQAMENEHGFLVLMPVYRPGADISNLESRRASLIGDTAAVFRAGDLMQKTLAAAHLLDMPDIVIDIYGNSANGVRTLVFHSGDAGARDGLPQWLTSWVPASLGYKTPHTSSRTFEVAGQDWNIMVSAPPAPLIQAHLSSLLVLVAGLLLTLLASAYLYTLVVRSRRVQKLVEAKTVELRLINELLSEDIIARRQTEMALKLRERAIEASANAILILRADGAEYPIEYVNPAFERITGYSADEVIGRGIRILEGSRTDPQSLKQIYGAMSERREGNAVLLNHRKDGTPLWTDFYVAPVRNADGETSHFVAALYDITSMKHYEAELEFQASRDTLTGLANRAMLRDSLSQAIAYAQRSGQSVWVVFIDLDRFKFINDTLGHKAGDILLKTLAGRLQNNLRDSDIAARLGGDEFVLVLPEHTGQERDPTHLQRIMDKLAEPVVVEGHSFFLTCSIGVSVYPFDGDDPEQLIKHADIAMYRAKQSGRNNFQFYTSAMNEQALERLRIESDLRAALERSEFLLHYQPKVDVESGQVTGMEALIRWHHPEFGMVLPGRFIGLAEETGLIVPIGTWVIRSACAQNKAWQDAGLPAMRISVNLSARQFAQNDLVQSIAGILRETGLEAHCLEIELTESLVMTDVDHAIAVLQQLKLLGVKLSIDDFGTGYSSLAYLKRFPIDVLKIDQSFVRDITVDLDDAAITVSIISLGHNLKLMVIAEGVETQEQLAYLRHHGCDEVQGYLFSRPLPADEFEAELRRSAFRIPTVDIS
ncbi:MAG: signal transduction protein containing a rane domain, an and a domain protein [Herbaspirillum sp.]|jgi:diguanylate cyclase (GGDEF)-like protein/PAS domain S-box-containing protein|nr:signal transduction protein containing a rane domain, an and a domain protein [Herbaspirillum sp.]